MPPSASVLQLLELALLTLQDGIAVLSSDGVLQYINKSAQQICFRSYGTTPAAGKYFFDFITDKKQAREACSSFERALRHQSSVRKVQVRIGDLESWFEMGYYPMAAENGTVSYVCATAKDITESVMLERKLTLQRQTQKNEVIRAALEAQGRERSFIGRELHDNVNQVLTTVRLYLDMNLQKEVPDKVILEKTLQHVDFCIREIRNLSHRLNPFDWLENSQEPLQELLQGLVGSINDTGKIQINFFHHGMDKLRLGYEMRTSIYRVVQELLTNILKHAGATMVDFFLVGTSLNLSLRISDNGSGFDMAQTQAGSGIKSIRQRVHDLGGGLQFHTSKGEGCTARVEIPLAGEVSG